MESHSERICNLIRFYIIVSEINIISQIGYVPIKRRGIGKGPQFIFVSNEFAINWLNNQDIPPYIKYNIMKRSWGESPTFRYIRSDQNIIKIFFHFLNRRELSEDSIRKVNGRQRF